MGFKLGTNRGNYASGGVIKTKMRFGKQAYADDHIMYNGERFEREDINGVDSILVDGKWKEAGDTGFPWEDDANNGNI